jgi:hypothetical protein
MKTLKAHRHHRGPLVFCHRTGKSLTKGETKHLVMRGAHGSTMPSMWSFLPLMVMLGNPSASTYTSLP